MNETIIENTDSQIVADENLEVVENETAEEKAERLEASNKQLFARAKKAEGFELVEGKWVKTTKPATVETKPKATENSNLDQRDIIAIIKADIPEDDIEEIVEYAKFKKISVSEALKSSTVKTILADKAEQRRVAEGTSTGVTRRGSAKLSDEALLSDAINGKFPEKDEDIQRLIRLQRAKK